VIATFKHSTWKYGVLDDAVTKGSSNISHGKIKEDDGVYPVYGAKGYLQNISFYQQERDYLAIIKDGAGIGRVSEHPSKSSVLATMQYLLPNDGFEIGFVKYFLESIDFEEYRTGSTIPHIYFKDYMSAPFPLAPIPEQKRIVAILDQVFADIEQARAKTEQNLNNARELFESYLQQVFSQRGDGWEELTLGLASGGVYTGPFGSLLHKSDYIENGIPLVNPAHITMRGIEPDSRKTVSKENADRLSNYVMRQGDIVIGRRGEMGRCALITEKEDGFLCGTGSFIIRASDRFHGGYLVRFLRSANCKARLEKIAGGAVMPNLSNTDLSNLNLFVPPIDKQNEIIELIDLLAIETEAIVSIYKKKQEALNELKKSILQKAFSGELTKTLNKNTNKGTAT